MRTSESTLIVRACQAADAESWDRFVRNSKNATFLLQRNFMDYHADRFSDASLMVFEGEHLCALLPANRDGNLVHSHQGLTYGGLVLAPDVRLLDVLRYVDALLRHLAHDGITHLHYKEIPAFYCQAPCDDTQYALFLCDAQLTRRDTAMVLERFGRQPVQQRRRRGINKAQRSGVRIEQNQNLQAFWEQLLMPNLQQRHATEPTHTLAEIQHLAAQFPQQILQYDALLDDRLVAGTTLFCDRGVAHAQYIAANDAGRKSGALDYLFDRLINEVFTDHIFDFGICNTDQGQSLNTGLADWKEGFGARTCSHNFYRVRCGDHAKLQQVISAGR